ncbi:MAG: hypothetical protein ABIJ58_01520 [Nanoarchaeota archaeon]
MGENLKERFKGRLEKIAEIEGIPKEKLIMDEADYFHDKHHYHGGYVIECYVDGNGELDSIEVECAADVLDEKELRAHEEESEELSYSIVYSRRPVNEISIQKERRQEEDYK